MGTVTPQELLNLWRLEQIPVEMAMGHVIQNLVELKTTTDALHRTNSRLRSDLQRLANQVNLPPDTKNKKKGNGS